MGKGSKNRGSGTAGAGAGAASGTGGTSSSDVTSSSVTAVGSSATSSSTPSSSRTTTIGIDDKLVVVLASVVDNDNSENGGTGTGTGTSGARASSSSTSTPAAAAKASVIEIFSSNPSTLSVATLFPRINKWTLRMISRWLAACALLSFLLGFGFGCTFGGGNSPYAVQRIVGLITGRPTGQSMTHSRSSAGVDYADDGSGGSHISHGEIPPEQWKVRIGQNVRSSFLYKLMYPEHLRKKKIEYQHRLREKQLKRQRKQLRKLRQKHRQQQEVIGGGGGGGGEAAVEGRRRRSRPSSSAPGGAGGREASTAPSGELGDNYFGEDERMYSTGELNTYVDITYDHYLDDDVINYDDGEDDDDDDDDDDDELSDVLDSFQYRRVPSRLELYTIGVFATLIEWSGVFNFTDYAIREYQKERELKQQYQMQQQQQQQQQDVQGNFDKYQSQKTATSHTPNKAQQKEPDSMSTSSSQKSTAKSRPTDSSVGGGFGGGELKVNEYDDAIAVTNVAVAGSKNFDVHVAPLRQDPSHPFVYAVLREAVVREKGGYVHYDLGILEPAPCGAARGIGMVRNNYGTCQQHCMPGIASEKLDVQQQQRHLKRNETPTTTTVTADGDVNSDSGERPKKYFQEEVLIKVPLSYQMTRKVALDTLLPRIPAEIQANANLHDLDDFVLLTLLLAHERGVGRYSRWLPYVASLPLEPTCGYRASQRPYKLDALNVLYHEYGLDVKGWSSELTKAQQNADRIVAALNGYYGASISHPKHVSSKENLSWALCQVASRAIGGKSKYGTLRLVPLLDMVNHDFNYGSFVELTGKERLVEGDFIDAIHETDVGAFVLRSLRHGRRKALRVGQELLANYNVPQYSALDWFINMGFVPRERFNQWTKLDPALPRVRRDGPFSLHDPSASSTIDRHILYDA